MIKCSSIIPNSQCHYFDNNGNEKNIDIDKYCISENDKKIYKSSNGSCTTAINNSESIEPYIFRKSNNGFEKAVYGDSSIVIYSCDDVTGCTQLISAYKYIVVNEKSYFYKCEDNGFCDIHTPNMGYYVDNIPNEYFYYSNLINCTTTTECINVAKPNPGYYINAETPTKVIYCIASKGCQLQETKINKNEKVFYINGNDGTDRSVFYCNAQQCSEESKKDGMLYLTGRKINTEQVILCGEKCHYTSFNQKCNEASDNGNIYYDESKNHIELCSSQNENAHWIDISLENTNSTEYYTFPPSLIQNFFPDIKEITGNIIKVMKSGFYIEKGKYSHYYYHYYAIFFVIIYNYKLLENEI